MKKKKILCLCLATFASAGVCVAAGISKKMVMVKGGEVDKSKTYVFDETTRDGYNFSYNSTPTFTDTDLVIDPNFTLELRGVARSNDSTNWFCRVNKGSTIAKQQESYDITSLTVNYSGGNQPEVRFFVNKGDTSFYKPSYSAGVPIKVFGYNYFTITAIATHNLEFSISYGCETKITGEETLTAKLKEGICYTEGVVPSVEDFDIALVTKSGKAIPVSSTDCSVSFANDFATNGGDATISYGNKNCVVSNIKLANKAEADSIKLECEDAEIVGATGLVQLAEFADPTAPAKGTEYETFGASCSYCGMHAAAYLNYPDDSEVKCSGNDTNMGGLVHNFDKNKNAKITFKFMTDSAQYALLRVRGASNDTLNGAGTYETRKVDLRKRVSFVLNKESINTRLNSSYVFLPAFSGSSSNPNERNYSSNGFGLSGRYKYIEWVDVNLCVVKLVKGINVFEMAPIEDNAGQWDYIEFVPVEGEIDDQSMKIECEDFKLNGAKVLKQVKEVEDYTKFGTGTYYDDCGNGAFHAAAYLGFQGTPYECSGSDSFGGFVHNFNNPSSMTFTFNSSKEMDYDLYIRAASDKNKAGNETDGYTVESIKVADDVSIKMNNSSVSINNDAYLQGKAEPFKDTNITRTGSFGGLDITGRYMMLLWTRCYVGTVHVVKGENTFVIETTSNWANSHGNWDYVEFLQR